MEKHSFLIPRSLNYYSMQQRPHLLFKEFVNAGNQCYWINENCESLDGARGVQKPTESEDGVIVLPQDTQWQSIDFDTLYYSYPPAGMDIIESKRPEFTIFDSLDSPSEDSPFAFWNAGGLYYKALEKSDLVLATSQVLVDEAEKYSSNVLYCPNAVDIDIFKEECKASKVFENETRPIVGYIGAIAQWMDFGLIYRVAKAMPECLFVFVGSSFVSNTIPSLPNVKFLGHIPHSLVPSFIYSFDVATIPFIASRPEIRACDPIKLYEYFATGVPVVTTAMKETQRDGVYWSQNIDEYTENLYKALNEKGNKRRKERMKVAEQNTWKIRVESILKRMDEGL